MIKIFRKTRQEQVKSGNMRKYMLYAIGEILLVVVGILIALRVNNWNQGQQRNALEEKILLEIENNLKDDIIDVVDELESFNVVIKTDSMLIQHIQSKRPYTDSIGALIHVFQMSPHLTIEKNGYKLLESKGIDLVSNDALRKQITNLYEKEYPYYFTYAEERFTMVESIIQPFMAQHFYTESYSKWPYYQRVPIDYVSLLDDNKLISLFKLSSYHATIMSRRSANLKEEVEGLQNDIREYLEK